MQQQHLSESPKRDAANTNQVNHVDQVNNIENGEHSGYTNTIGSTETASDFTAGSPHSTGGWRQSLRQLLRQRALYIGLVCGIILTLLLGFLAYLLLSPYGVRYTPPATAQNGNVTITIDHDALNLGMQVALQQVQSQLPITIQHVSTTLYEGNRIDVRADGQSVLGITPRLVLSLSPTVAPDGTLDFMVRQITLNGLNVSLGGVVNRAIEQAMNKQFASYGEGTPIQGLHYQIVSVNTTTNALVITAQLTSS